MLVPVGIVTFCGTSGGGGVAWTGTGAGAEADCCATYTGSGECAG